MLADGLKPRRTRYQTIKEQIREAVDYATREAENEDEFFAILSERYHVGVKTSRGSWSYLHKGRTKPIRDRSLGRTYDRESVLKRIAGFREMPETVRPEYMPLPKIFLIRSELRLVTDLQTCVKAQQSRAYARKVTLSNLQEMARTVAWIQEQGIDSWEELAQRRFDAEEQYMAARDRCAELSAEIQGINEEIHLLGRYLAGKTAYGQFLKAEDKSAFRREHAEEIDSHEEAVRRLKEMFPDGFPSMKMLRARKAAYIKEQSEQKALLKTSGKQRRELEIASRNVEAMLEAPVPARARILRSGEALE